MTTSYSSLQKSFHWLTALLIVALVALGWGMVALPPSPEKLQFYSWHKWIGMTVLLLTGGRLVCRWWSGTPRHREMPAWMRMSAAANHAGIYLLLLALPILGWLMSSASGFPVVMLGLVPLPNLVSPDPDLAENLKAAHRFAGWGLLALLAVHVAAALLHRLVRGDGVLAAMLPRRRPTADSAMGAVITGLLGASLLVPLVLRPSLAVTVTTGSVGSSNVWTIDQAQSALEFEASQMGVPVRGRFARWNAAIQFDPHDPDAALARVEVELASARTGNRDVEQQLAGEAFFAATGFPRAVFQAAGFWPLGGDRYVIPGRLTLKGISLPLEIAASIRIAKDPADGELLRAEAQGGALLRRLDFKIGLGDWQKTDVIANDVRVRIRIVATRPIQG